MSIDRRTLTGGVALLGVGVGAPRAREEDFGEGAAVQRVFDSDGKLVQVWASIRPGAPWVDLSRDD